MKLNDFSTYQMPNWKLLVQNFNQYLGEVMEPADATGAQTMASYKQDLQDGVSLRDEQRYWLVLFGGYRNLAENNAELTALYRELVKSKSLAMRLFPTAEVSQAPILIEQFVRALPRNGEWYRVNPDGSFSIPESIDQVAAAIMTNLNRGNDLPVDARLADRPLVPAGTKLGPQNLPRPVANPLPTREGNVYGEDVSAVVASLEQEGGSKGSLETTVTTEQLQREADQEKAAKKKAKQKKTDEQQKLYEEQLAAWENQQQALRQQELAKGPKGRGKVRADKAGVGGGGSSQQKKPFYKKPAFQIAASTFLVGGGSTAAVVAQTIIS